MRKRGAKACLLLPFKWKVIVPLNCQNISKSFSLESTHSCANYNVGVWKDLVLGDILQRLAGESTNNLSSQFCDCSLRYKRSQPSKKNMRNKLPWQKKCITLSCFRLKRSKLADKRIRKLELTRNKIARETLVCGWLDCKCPSSGNALRIESSQSRLHWRMLLRNPVLVVILNINNSLRIL